MRQQILRTGGEELTYEIRGIVRRARQLQQLGVVIRWENIGDPIEKNNTLPQWMKDIISGLVQQDKSYGYCDSKGELATRQFVAERTNRRRGVQISAEDVLFFNGLGDAISKLYSFLNPASRVIGPSPAYSTHSSAEAAHASAPPITYKLDPANSWYPDMDDLRNKVKYNPNVVGVLIINPDNPTGMVYPRQVLEQFVELAREFNLFLVSDEIYINVTYNGATPTALAEVIGEVPGISLGGISKELPWPGARCGWMEFYNTNKDRDFGQLAQTLENAKMIEVCATRLPQMALPIILGDERYVPYRQEANAQIGERSRLLTEQLQDVEGIMFNPTNGAFYNTIIFEPGRLQPHQSLPAANPQAQALLDEWLAAEPNMALDRRFVYNLLAATGLCVVPISSFASELQGFRITLLEADTAQLKKNFADLGRAIVAYLAS